MNHSFSFSAYFREKVEQHQSLSTLSKLLVSYSRDVKPEGSPHYVQDNIKLHGKDIVKLIEEKGAVVYVCGDAKHMARDVLQAFSEIFAKEKG